jgi:hypothetical protein
MRCPKCGQENPAEAKFCGKCATRLAAAEPPIHPGPSGPMAIDGDVSQGLKIGIIVGTVIIPLLGIIMGLIYMNDPSPTKKAAGKTWLYVGIGVLAVECVCALASGILSNLSSQ